MTKAIDIRPIRPSDNAAVALLIREVMTEFGAVGCGYSIEDAEVDAMYEAYPAPRAAFFVVEEGDKVLGCGGMGPLAGGDEDVCELRKMYFRPGLRGRGLGSELLGVILKAARVAGYSQCYLETVERMEQARALYARNGFRVLDAPMGDTGHASCNHRMVREL